MEKILNLIPKLHVLQERKLSFMSIPYKLTFAVFVMGPTVKMKALIGTGWSVVVAGGCMRTAFYQILIIPSYVLYVDFHYFIIIHSFIDSTKNWHIRIL